MKYCRCKFAFANARVELIVGGSIPGPAWVCNSCDGVHHSVQIPEGRDLMYAPRGAVAPLSSVSHESGQSITRWATGDGVTEVVEFRPYPRVVPMADREPLLFKMWTLLMSKVDVILAPINGPGDNAIEADRRERAKFEARGIAEALAIVMHPFVDSADAVVKHAVKRFNDPDYQVPGLGEHLWDPSKNSDGSPRVVISDTRTKAFTTPAKKSSPRRAPAGKKLSEAEIEGIKEAVSSGMFSKEDLASVFKVSVAAIEEVTR